MADLINGSDHDIINWDSSTRVPPNAEPSSPDVSLALADEDALQPRSTSKLCQPKEG